MREIEFRAKRTDNDGWVYGYYFQELDFENKPINSSIVRNITTINPVYRTTEQDVYKIDINTLGQYTGLEDKNGKKIFEGDIVEFETNIDCLKDGLKPYWKDCIEKQMAIGNGTYFVRKDQAVVQWNSEQGMWDLKVYNNGKYKRKSKLFTFRESGYVVIGNIWDNPELLKGEKQNGDKCGRIFK